MTSIVRHFIYIAFALFILCIYIAMLRVSGTNSLSLSAIGFLVAAAGFLKQELRIATRKYLLDFNDWFTKSIEVVLYSGRASLFKRSLNTTVLLMLLLFVILHVYELIKHEIYIYKIRSEIQEVESDSGGIYEKAISLANISNLFGYVPLGVNARYNWERYQLKRKDEYHKKVSFARSFLDARNISKQDNYKTGCIFIMLFCSKLPQSADPKTGLQHFNYLVYLDSRIPESCPEKFEHVRPLEREYDSDELFTDLNVDDLSVASKYLKKWAVEYVQLGNKSKTEICEYRESFRERLNHIDPLNSFDAAIVLNTLFILDTSLLIMNENCSSDPFELTTQYCEIKRDELLESSSRLSSIYSSFSPSNRMIEINLVKLDYFSLRNTLSGGQVDIDLYLCDRKEKEYFIKSLNVFNEECSKKNINNWGRDWRSIAVNEDPISIITLHKIHDRTVERNLTSWNKFSLRLNSIQTQTIHSPLFEKIFSRNTND